jgi:hypothetical protein
MATEWKEEEIKGIKCSRSEEIKTLLFAVEKVIVADSEDAPQISIHILEIVTSKYGLKILTSKTKTKTLKGRAIARNKIVIKRIL